MGRIVQPRQGTGIKATTFDALHQALPALARADNLRALIYYDLGKQMRAHKVTLRQLAAAGDLTLVRIREILHGDKVNVPYITALDIQELIEMVAGVRPKDSIVARRLEKTELDKLTAATEGQAVKVYEGGKR